MASRTLTKADLDRLLAEERARVRALEEEAVAYKAKVRARALEAADSEGWCTSGLNSALTDLGLEPVSTDYKVEATIYLQAADDDSASALAYDALEVAGDLFVKQALPKVSKQETNDYNVDEVRIDARWCD